MHPSRYMTHKLKSPLRIALHIYNLMSVCGDYKDLYSLDNAGVAKIIMEFECERVSICVYIKMQSQILQTDLH